MGEPPQPASPSQGPGKAPPDADGEALHHAAKLWTNVEKYATPGEEHLLLHRLLGPWRMEFDLGIGIGGQRVQQTGLGQGRLILGGRFVELRHSLGAANGPVEAVKTWGFDRIYQQYVGTYMDTLGTGLLTFKGSWDEERQTLWEWGILSDAARGMRHPITAALQLGNPDLLIYNFSFPGPGGKLADYMQIRMQRISAP